MVCCCNTIGNIFRLVIVCGCVFALGMQFLNIYSCDFIHSKSDDSLSIGIWFQTTLSSDGTGTVECNFDEGSYTAEENSLVAGARSALIISMLCGIAALVMVMFEWCLCEICCAGILEGAAFVGAWFCGAGVYMIYGIDGCGKLEDEINDITGDDTISNFGESLIPDSIINIPTGSDCDWGQGATYNLLACIAYFGCGILLCCTPQPKPICKQ